MIRIKIKSRGRYNIFEIEVPEDIPIFKMHEIFCETSGYPMRRHSPYLYHYLYHGKVLDYDSDLSDYGISDGDIIELIDRNDMRGGGDIKEGGGERGGSHICPYGCGRQIPDGYKGCTELLQAQPNYFG